MGCGQSKINLYPRRNKNGGKGHSAKKSGAAEKEADEDEGSAGSAAPPDEPAHDPERGKHLLPLSIHSTAVQVSESQQDFFKMLDDKIEKGRDYDSSSETEIQLEQERRKNLIQQWRATSLSSHSHSSQSQASPPTPAKKRVNRPMPQPPERQSSPASGRRCYRTQHVPDGMSPPPRRAHSSQLQLHTDSRQTNGDNWSDPTKSPVKRPQSAGANWKNNPKVVLFGQKPKKSEANENHKAQTESDDQSNQDISQVTFNPTFQTHSPAHSAKKAQQPYITQIISYPSSQQVTPPSPPKVIAPPEEYQDPDNIVNDNCSQRSSGPSLSSSQSNIYYIHGNATATAAPDLAQQRQQTAIHLQQYVAMKQAQQQMYTYFQRSPHTVFPNVDFTQAANRGYEADDYQYVHPAMRPHSAPTPVGVVRPMPVAPGYNPMADGSHMVQMPMWPHMPPVVSTMGPWAGQVPPEMQYYPQSQFIPMYRPNSAGSAGTLTRYKKEPNESETKNVCQSINLVRQKPIGQIVSLGGQELTVCNNASDSPSPASVSTDSGLSPGSSSAPSSKSSVTPPAAAPPAAVTVAPPAPPVAPPANHKATANPDRSKKNKIVSLSVRSLKSSKSLDS